MMFFSPLRKICFSFLCYERNEDCDTAETEVGQGLCDDYFALSCDDQAVADDCAVLRNVYLGLVGVEPSWPIPSLRSRGLINDGLVTDRKLVVPEACLEYNGRQKGVCIGYDSIRGGTCPTNPDQEKCQKIVAKYQQKFPGEPFPSTTAAPSTAPSTNPAPSTTPSTSTAPSSFPTAQPSTSPTLSPSEDPTDQPSQSPSASPSDQPSNRPSLSPSQSIQPSLSSSPTIPCTLDDTGTECTGNADQINAWCASLPVGDQCCGGGINQINNYACISFDMATISKKSCKYSCSGLGDGVIIKEGSCNEYGSCDNLWDGAIIKENSCNGQLSCESLGFESTAPVTVESNSCNGFSACYAAGVLTSGGVIESNSCLGAYSCEYVAFKSKGYFRVESDSCLTIDSCAYCGEDHPGNVTVFQPNTCTLF